MVGLHWGCGGATLRLLWGHTADVTTHAANGRTPYYGEPRTRARARMQLGATLGLLWWSYTGVVVELLWACCEDTTGL